MNVGDRRLRPDRPASAPGRWASASCWSPCADVVLGPRRAPGARSTRAASPSSRLRERSIARSDVDLVVVATTNDVLAPLTLAAVEPASTCSSRSRPPQRRRARPGDRRPRERAASSSRSASTIAFTRRFRKAREIWDSGVLRPADVHPRRATATAAGSATSASGAATRRSSGGGELLDQGVHLIDLARWFAGDFVEVEGRVEHVLLGHGRSRTTGSRCCGRRPGQVAWLHASCTEWKNLFSFEIYGRDGKLQIDGLGGSYGVERLTFYQMLPEMGPPETTDLGVSRRGSLLARRVRRTSSDCIRDGAPAAGRPATTRVAALSRSSKQLYRALGASAMIITRSPLRISLGGGGTDLPSYYREHSGFLDRRRHRQVRLHHAAPDVRRRADRQVLEAGARADASTRSSTRSSARRCS